jgi:diguanylate cyclase (GGDEF)-like protein
VVLGAVSQMVERFSPSGRPWIMLLRDGRLTRVAECHLPASFVEQLDGHSLQIVRELCAAAESQGPAEIVTSELATGACWAPLREAAAELGLRWCRLTRIVSGDGEVLGTIALLGSQPASADDGEREMLLLASRLAALAVEHDHLDERLIHRAHHDALTSLPNRSLLEERLEQALARARRAGRTVGLMFLDIDGFKLINDSLGHQLGDDLLRGFAARVAGAIGPDDLLARMGGDEFMIALPDLTDGSQPAVTASASSKRFRSRFALAGKELYLGTSIGIAMFPQDAQDVQTLEQHADAAMYRAKQLGAATSSSSPPR